MHLRSKHLEDGTKRSVHARSTTVVNDWGGVPMDRSTSINRYCQFCTVRLVSFLPLSYFEMAYLHRRTMSAIMLVSIQFAEMIPNVWAHRYFSSLVLESW